MPPRIETLLAPRTLWQLREAAPVCGPAADAGTNVIEATLYGESLRPRVLRSL